MPNAALETQNFAGIVNYGGVELKIVRVIQWETRPVYSQDDCDRLYLHHRLSVECWWNPEATSSGRGKVGIQSIKELRQQLLRERQRLTVRVGRIVALESPLPRIRAEGYYTRDARNGPLPIAFRILEICADKTVKAVFEVETWVPLDCPFDSSRSPVLSHRWEMSERIDETFLSRRTVKGWANFRTDTLDDNNLVPDDFRGRLSHPLPPFFKRENVSVVASSDGTSVNYSFEDQETPGVNLSTGIYGPIAKVRGTWRMGWTGQRDFLPSSWNPMEWAKESLRTGRRVAVTIQAWGRRASTRQDLINAVIKGAQAYGFDDFKSIHAYSHMDLQVDLWDKFAQLDAGFLLDGVQANLLQMAFESSKGGGGVKIVKTIITSFIKVFGGASAGTVADALIPGGVVEDIIRLRMFSPAFGPASKAREIITDFPDPIEGLTTTEDVPNPWPPSTTGTRGSSLETMIAQVLLEQCRTPAPAPGSTAKRPNRTF